jgi:hypothetical protein
MKIINPEQKIKPFLNKDSHSRLRHTYALWHPEVKEQRKKEEKRLEKNGLGNRIPFENSPKKSRFDSYSIALEAIEKSYNYPAVVNQRGYLETTFSLGYEVGYDERRDCRTKTVTIVTTIDGNVITAFPGLPG